MFFVSSIFNCFFKKIYNIYKIFTNSADIYHVV